jgi:hypothetical protein
MKIKERAEGARRAVRYQRATNKEIEGEDNLTKQDMVFENRKARANAMKINI